MHVEPTAADSRPSTDARGVSILARSLFRQMQEQGFTQDQIISLSSELIQLVSEGMQRRLVAE
jgi:hypothetical protein